jgi:ABC-type uncharacterized transport system auxiliary subunit
MSIALRVLALACGALALVACIPTGTVAPRQFYLIEDTGAKAPPPAAPVDRTLLVNGIASDAFYENRSLVYSRKPGQRAYYQFASWTDQPARRIALLTERRLEQRNSFRSVAPIDSGASGELLLTVTVDEVLHDDGAPPGAGRVVLTGELMQRQGRKIIDRRQFVATVPAREESAEGAVAAINAAVSNAIDAVVVWTEEAARTAPPPAGAASRE